MATIAGAVTAYVTLVFVVGGINQETFVGIMIQGITAGVMGIVAIVLTYAVGNSPELKEIYRSFQSRILKTDVIAPQ